MESESDGRPPASRLDGATMDVYRCCRFKRKAFVVTVMVCGCMCFALYTLSFSCCAVVIAGVENTGNSRGSNVVLLDSVRSARYERSYADSQKPENRFVRKTLAQDKSEDIINGERTGESRDNYKMGVHNHFSASPVGSQDTNKELRYNGDERAAQSDNVGEPGHLDTSDNVYAQNAARGTRTSEGVDTNGMKNVPVSGIVRVHKRGSRKMPQAVIIGVKKGGTRALLEFIRMHPDVRAPGPETHFFDRHYHRGMEWYRNQMPPTIEGQITMEKTPSYFVTREVPRRIYNMSKDMKLLVVVRDPVTRAISDYTQTLTKRPGVLKPFEEMAFLNNSTGLVDTSWGAIRIGVYAKHLERWLKYFPLSQIHFVSGERLITDPATELAKVQDFLGLKRVITEKHFYFNETKGFPCLKKPEGSSNPHCLGKTKGRRHPQIDPKVLQRLRLFFRPFNAKFYQMTNQNFGWD